MNKKTITLRIDPISKLIMLIPGTGVWVIALKPLGASEVRAAGQESTEILSDMAKNIFELKTIVENSIPATLLRIDKNTGVTAGQIAQVNGKLLDIKFDVELIRKRQP